MNLNDFLASIAETKFFSEEGEMPSGCYSFASRVDAKYAADGLCDEAGYAARAAAILAKELEALKAANTAYAAYVDAHAHAHAEAGISAEEAADAIRDASLVASCLAAWNDHTEANTAYALRRWQVWKAGFGVLGDIQGTLYCYRRWK